MLPLAAHNSNIARSSILSPLVPNRASTPRHLLTNKPFLQLLVGLVVSCMLFILTFFLSSAGRTEQGSTDLKNTGILQITWLLGNDSHFAGIQKPETHALRKAGMFEVEMDAMAREKINQALNDYEADATESTKLNDIHITVDDA